MHLTTFVFIASAVVLLIAVTFNVYVAVAYLPYKDIKRTQDRTKHNPPFPDDLGVDQISLLYGPSWDTLGKEAYRVYGFASSGSNCVVEAPTQEEYAEIVTNYTANDDSLEECTQELVNKTVALAKWRGSSARPPKRVSFKMKLYVCDPDELEWKKEKDICIGSASDANTFKWTLRIDSSDFVGGLRDLLAIDTHRELNGADNMYGAPVAVRVNTEYLGSMLFVSSPDDKILHEDFDEDRDFFIKFDGREDEVGDGAYEGNGWGEIIGRDVFVKTPDPDDYPFPSNQSNEVGTPQQLRALLDAFHDGTASYDFDSFAGRLLMEILAPQRDWDRSAYFYTINSTWFAGPVWDMASFGGAEQTCTSRPLTETTGWNPTTMSLYEGVLSNQHFVAHTIAVWREKNLTTFLKNTYLPQLNGRFDKLAPYDWSIWGDVYRFVCNPYVFMPGNAYRDYGGSVQYTVYDKHHTSYGDWLLRRSDWLDGHINELQYYKSAPEQRQRWWGVIFFSFIILSLIIVFGVPIFIYYFFYKSRSDSTITYKLIM